MDQNKTNTPMATGDLIVKVAELTVEINNLRQKIDREVSPAWSIDELKTMYQEIENLTATRLELAKDLNARIKVYY